MVKHLVTAALPYANGQVHFGHIAGAYLPADIYVRHLRLKGHNVKFVCGTDEHGVAIMLSAKKQGRDYKSYVDNWHKKQSELFKQIGIEFDVFGQTSAKYHEEEVLIWFKELHAKGFIEPRDGRQLFCNDCKNHLPDRFVEGVCYECGYEKARGDECPNCGIWIDSIRLKKPVCMICGSKNIEEVTVTQYYLLLSKAFDQYREWFKTKSHWRKTVYPYVESLTNKGLIDRAISRDLDWGIDVPLPEAKGKKLYVWFDAPIGYVSNLKKLLEDTKSTEHYLKDWWNSKDVRITNFIGKDNIIFHAVIFPIMSMIAGRVRTVDDLPANQFLNLEGKQFSKSNNWYVDAEQALADFGQDAIRYYLTSIMPESSDSSFTWANFADRVNNELANNIGNFINRSMKFFDKNWKDGISSKLISDFSSSEHGKRAVELIKLIVESLDGVHIKKGIETVMSLGKEANNYFSDNEPWAKIKVDNEGAAKVIGHSACYSIVLATMLEPFLPLLSAKIFALFGSAVSVEMKKKIYNGDVTIFDHWNGSLKLVEVPTVLVPKIEDDVAARKIT